MTIGTRDNPASNRTTKTEPKVWAATTGGGAGAVLAGFVLWALDVYVITPGTDGDIPVPVKLFVELACAAGVAWFAGRQAKHQWRQAETRQPNRSEKVVEPEGLE